jgi:hypothetical protein
MRCSNLVRLLVGGFFLLLGGGYVFAFQPGGGHHVLKRISFGAAERARRSQPLDSGGGSRVYPGGE